MMSALGVVAIPVLLGLAFLGLHKSERHAWRRLGPWLVGAAGCVIATGTIALYDYGISGLLQPTRSHQLQEIATTAAVMALLSSEAVIVSRWAVTTTAARPAHRYLVVFTCATLTAWFLTGLLFWATVPGS
jgi:hypothetical protein